MTSENLLKALLGKDKIMAAKLCKQSGMKPRLCREDKIMFMGTADLNFERINLEYDNGLVTNAYIG
jgi:hypothetical protein